MTRCRLLWLSGCVFTTSVAEAQEAGRRTVSGVVTDSTRMPLAYVNIVFGSSRTMSDDSGRFMIRSVSRAPFRFLMRRIGFQAEEVSLPA
jgi:hypothetical protein